MEEYHKKLASKGWSAADIQKTISIIGAADQKKSDSVRFLDAIVYWIFLIVVIVGNMVIAIVLVPILLTLRGFYLHLIIAVIGLTFGFLFEILIRDIEVIEKKTVVVTWLFMPSIAAISVYFMTNFANFLEESMRLENAHSSIIIGCVYAIAFIFPYFYYRFIKHYTLVRVD